jgi:hypothetical protein
MMFAGAQHFRSRPAAVSSIALLLLVLFSTGSGAPAIAQEGTPVPGGRFFTEAGGDAGGFLITDSDGVPFWTAYQRLGGSTLLGYPASRRFELNGSVYQLTQASVLRRGPEGTVTLADTFDLLSEAGQDHWLEQSKGVPLAVPLDKFQNTSATAEQRLAWLTQPEIADRYFANPSPERIPEWSRDDAIRLYGLPMSRPIVFGPFIAQRFQRVALQLWTAETTNGAAVGHVSAVLGGDLLKEARLVPAAALEPQSLDEFNDSIVRLGESSPTPTPVPTSMPTRTATVLPTATATPLPKVTILSRHAITGKEQGGYSADDVFVRGEVRNDSAAPVAWDVTTSLHDASGRTVASAQMSKTYGFRPDVYGLELLPGEVQPYQLVIEKAPPFTTFSVTASATEWAQSGCCNLRGTSARLPGTFSLRSIPTPTPYFRGLAPPTPTGRTSAYPVRQLTGSMTNNTSHPVTPHLVVWYLDGSGRVVYADVIHPRPAPLYPGITASLEVATSLLDAASAKWIVWGQWAQN